MSSNDYIVPTYSLGQPSMRTGLGGLSMKTTAVIGAGFFLMLMLMLAGQMLLAFLVVLPITAALAVLVTLTINGRSLAQNLQMGWDTRRRRQRGEDYYLSGPSSRIPGGRGRWPGILARTEAHTSYDATGHEFVTIVDRPSRKATVLLDCQLSGQTAMTQDDRNRLTSSWDHWMRQLSMTGDIDHTAFVVATRPSSGELLAKEVASTVHEDAPLVARIIQQEAAQVLRGGLSEIDAHLAITFKIHSSGADDLGFLDAISTRLPALYESLSWCGIQSAPMTEDELVARVHGMVNPAAEPEFEELMVEGTAHGLAWEDSGPAVSWVDKDVWHHDGVSSVTWEMADAPRSTFQDTLLAPLLMPHERIPRKRVAIIYRPFDSGSGSSRVEAEHQDALVGVNSSKKITSAKAEMRLEHTDAARRAQGGGAQLGKTSLFVTATIAEPGELRRLREDVRQQAAQCNLRLRSMKHQPDTGFMVTAGLGQTPWAKTSTSPLIGA
ncbi:SCO6880 family protein [Corynebacterium sp. A21]|uniref:SCO6880 family protein n=1 Tax=Corynebacterium sp. A21 TaxID=3457318 RepID=UPI003FD0FB90